MPAAKVDKKNEITPAMEDYLEAILEVAEETGSKDVRVSDIARKLRVTRPSVVGMLRHLEEHGLSEHDHYGGVRLSAMGLKIARDMMHRHHVLRKFLEEVLGLDAEIAETDACRMEHTLSPETIARFMALEEFRQGSDEREHLRQDSFRKFLKEKKKKR